MYIFQFTVLNPAVKHCYIFNSMSNFSLESRKYCSLKHNKAGVYIPCSIQPPRD